jgi:hypothetical protein
MQEQSWEKEGEFTFGGKRTRLDCRKFDPESKQESTFFRAHVRMNRMRANRLQTALDGLSSALQEAQNALAEMRAESDALSAHIFVSRRQYRNMADTKGGKRHETAARLSWQTACDLGFGASLGEWSRLMGATPKR